MVKIVMLANQVSRLQQTTALLHVKLTLNANIGSTTGLLLKETTALLDICKYGPLGMV